MLVTTEAPADSDPVLSSADLTSLVDQLHRVDHNAPDAELIDQITALERIKSACAAAQAALTLTFVDSQTAGLQPRIGFSAGDDEGRHHTRRGDSTTSGMLWRHSNGCGDRRKGGGHVRRFIIRSKVPISLIMSSSRMIGGACPPVPPARLLSRPRRSSTSPVHVPKRSAS